MSQKDQLPKIVSQMVSDIKNFKVRSATTIAKATYETMEKYMEEYEVGSKSADQVMQDYLKSTKALAYARDTEPMARNGMRFVKYSVDQLEISNAEELRQALVEYSAKYFDIIVNAKERVVRHGFNLLKDSRVIYTHCNSTVAYEILVAINNVNPDLKVVVDETRPRKQGRITATKLNDVGVDEVLIADTAASSFIIDDRNLPVDAVIVGADEITAEGDLINQIGTMNVALAAKEANKPLYVVTPSLKFGPETLFSDSDIEYRDVSEVWKDAPTGMKIINPVFEKVRSRYLGGYILEFGLTRPSQVKEQVFSEYRWLETKLN